MDPTTPPATCTYPSGAAAATFMAAISALTQLQCDIGDPSIYPTDAKPDPVYDFIVVGAGSAGSVIANRLSVICDWKVLLLEAGGDPPYTSDVPALYPTLQNTDVDWQYRTDGEGDYCAGMVNHQCSWPRGKALGGSSAINGMTYLRGHPTDYQRWVEKGNTGWDYKGMKRFFEKSEGITHGVDTGHLFLEKFDGGASTGELPLLSPLTGAVRELQYRAAKDYEILTYPGFFNTIGTISHGSRVSVAKAYLSPVKSRENLDVVKNALVTKIIFNDDKRATGVEYEKGSKTSIVKAKKEIVVSAGAINSPQLLMLSGIGPKSHLTGHGINVLADLPVGYNLQDHVLVPGVIASINRDVAVTPNSTKELIKTVVEYLVDRKGPLSGVGYVQFTGFVHTTRLKDLLYPDNQIQFILFAKDDPDSLSVSLSSFGYDEEVSSSFISLLKEADMLIIAPSIIHPESRGRIRLKTTDPHDHPQITANYFEVEDDEIAMQGGIAESMKILKTISLKNAVKIEPRVLLESCLAKGKRSGKRDKSGRIDDSPLMTPAYWRCMTKKIASSDYHPVGTCKMGPSSKDSVVDPRLRVHFVKGLRVIDASIMPTITSGNINGPVVAIAEKGASMIIEDWTPAG